jgi:hypothetical protein
VTLGKLTVGAAVGLVGVNEGADEGDSVGVDDDGVWVGADVGEHDARQQRARHAPRI